jgi:hypothetical protein
MRYQDFNTISLLKESDENIEVRLDGQVVPGPYNDIDHARNKASKLVSYQKGKIGEVYVNGKLKMRMQLNQPREYFDEQQLGNNRFSDYDQWRDQVEQVGASVYPQKDRVRLVAQSWDGDVIGEFNLKTNQGYLNHQGVAEGFDELDAYIKSKNAPKPRGGAGVKQGVYGTPERKRGRGRGPIGGSGSATPSNRDFSRPHSIPRATPRGIDDYDANYRRELDEAGGLPPNVLDLIKKIAQSTAAPEHKTAMINSLIAKHASDQGPNKHKVKTQEGLMPGEYYTYQVTFDDGSTDTINVRSDEFDFRSHYAKKGKTVTRVVQQGGIQGSGFGGTTNDPYADSRERQDRTSRAMRQYDRKLAEVAQKLRAKYLSK